MEELGALVGFVLTLMVYSYLIRDNFLYRIAVYVFVGMTAGYISIVTVESILVPWFDVTINKGDTGSLAIGLIPVLFAILLLLKTSGRLARLGNIGMGFVIGVGAAVALVGALIGTLIPLSNLTIKQADGDLLDAVLIFIGVASSLVYFQYLARKNPEGVIERARSVQTIAVVGQGFVVITLGALYGAAIITSLTIFSERISYVLGQF